jgi:hypothetical protein
MAASTEATDIERSLSNLAAWSMISDDQRWVRKLIRE